jgi:hypothetical protein
LVSAIDRDDLKRPADLDAVNAFMTFVDDITDKANRKSFANEGTGANVAGIPGPLLGALRVLSEDELAFIVRLRRVLDDAKLYDEYNPRLYYL